MASRPTHIPTVRASREEPGGKGVSPLHANVTGKFYSQTDRFVGTLLTRQACGRKQGNKPDRQE